jgi:serine phosphatase RsbU (regulator of sigma subunit)
VIYLRGAHVRTTPKLNLKGFMNHQHPNKGPTRVHKSVCLHVLLLASLFFCLASHTRAQAASEVAASDAFQLTADKLHSDWEGELNKAGWRYRAGDDERYQAGDYDDSDWEKLSNTQFFLERMPRDGWMGKGWFRLRVTVDEQLAREILALRFWNWGASEVYLDGKLIGRFGTITANDDVEFNPNGAPVLFTFETGGTHVIAVRYSFQAARDLSRGIGKWLARGEYHPGINPVLQTARYAVADYAQKGRASGWVSLFAGILCALALLHFLLFLFYRRERANLFYSLFAFCLAMSIMFLAIRSLDIQIAFVSGLLWVLFLVSFAMAMPSLLAFLYVAFSEKFSKLFWTCLALCLSAAIFATIFVRTRATLYVVCIAFILTLLDAVRLVVQALLKRREGARIIAVGVLLFAGGIAALIAPDLLKIGQPHELIQITRELFIYLAIPISVSIFLARNFARTNMNLEAQLAQVKELSVKQLEHEQMRAENERRAKELEEARQLQLSMLPKSVPHLPNVEIAAYMKPASEVGGDYYDFHLGDDGTLTVAVGDATGHGLKAGTMVTATKSLFNNLAHEADITYIFKQTSAALKKMNLRGLFMAMTMLKITDHRLIVSAAGMPSALIYRAATRQIEEVIIKAMPLGSVSNFAYRQQEFTLLSGDCVVVMSDGFPELFNEQNEMLDYAQARMTLAEVAKGSPQQIINRFVETGEKWAGNRPPDDDVTFVVVKIK